MFYCPDSCASNALIAAAKASGEGLGDKTSTLKCNVSLRNVEVVGPIAAMHVTLELESAGGSENRSCRIGVTKSAAEGAKYTIHHLSKPVRSVMQSAGSYIQPVACRSSPGGTDDTARARSAAKVEDPCVPYI